jgi:hypothetical protein
MRRPVGNGISLGEIRKLQGASATSGRGKMGRAAQDGEPENKDCWLHEFAFPVEGSSTLASRVTAAARDLRGFEAEISTALSLPGAIDNE